MKSATIVQRAWEKYVNGEKEAFGMVYDHYHRALTLFCLGKLKDLDSAENAASECLIKLLQQEDPKKIENLDHWIFTVAKNFCNTFWTKTNRRGNILKEIGGSQQSYKNPEIIRALNDHDINAMLMNILDEEMFKIWQLHQEGYNNDEISRKLGFKIKTIANKKSEARKLIRKALSKNN